MVDFYGRRNGEREREGESLVHYVTLSLPPNGRKEGRPREGVKVNCGSACSPVSHFQPSFWEGVFQEMERKGGSRTCKRMMGNAVVPLVMPL